MKTKLFTTFIIMWITALFAQDGTLKWRYKNGDSHYIVVPEKVYNINKNNTLMFIKLCLNYHKTV